MPPATERLHHLLNASAQRFPERIAVEDDGDGSITYAALDELSDRLCDRLAGIGVRPGDRVGILAPKSIETVAGIFAILKAGAAYVPVDATGPAARSAFVFEDCEVAAVLAHPDTLPGLEGAVSAADWRDEEIFPDFELQLFVPARSGSTADNSSQSPLAYILYTSGSTGNPKGVMISHSASLSFVHWCSKNFSPAPEDRFSSHAPFYFDLSILDLFVPLKHGATLVLIGDALGKNPRLLAEFIAERRLSVWYSTPGILRLLAAYGNLPELDHTSLRIVFFAGEVFPVKHLRALKEHWPNPSWYNLYGPTETNVCTWHPIPDQIDAAQTEPFPIGKVCANDCGRVVDFDFKDVAQGAEGELCISGGTVMEGYWNLPERTRDAFLPVGDGDDGQRWYRTGDLVRDIGDGVLDFIGRVDRMVKRRGYRVELGEIETALHRHPQVAEAAVVAIPDEDEGVVIKAFLASDADEKLSSIKLKKFCSENLPSYMIPDRIITLDSLPKTATDKTDYQSLLDLT